MNLKPVHTHPERQSILQEMHARPFMTLDGSYRLFFLSFLGTEKDRQARRADLDRILSESHFNIRFDSGMNVEAETGSWSLRWENHAEFSSFIITVPLHEAPVSQPALSCLPAGLRDNMPEDLFEAVDLVLDAEDHEAFPGKGELFGSRLGAGDLKLTTNMNADSQGFIRVMLCNSGEGPKETGRIVQLFLELMIYQKLAFLSLPLARRFGPTLRDIDDRIGSVARDLDAGDVDDNMLLAKITGKVNEIERVGAETAYRFSASRAYTDIVEQRLAQLREQRVSGMQTLREFIERRLVPAMNTCQSVEARQERLSRRTRTLADLLSTRVDVALERQNSELLQSMDDRARLQLRLQETVEGLSIVAISYYGVGLTGYIWKMAKSLGVISDPALWTGLSVPPVVLAVWLIVRRIRKGVVQRRKID